MANFRMGVAQPDAEVGQLMAMLDRPELRDNTLVIFYHRPRTRRL